MRGNSLLADALILYTEHVGWHRGKGAVIKGVRNALGLKVEGDQEVTRLGLRWVLNPNDHSEGTLFWLGQQDLWERWHIAKMLEPGSVFFDIGSNYGLYGITIANEPGNNVQVHAFEPNPEMYRRLARNVSLNGLRNIHPHNVGLGDWEGTAALVVHNATNSGATSLGKGEGAAITTLDAFCDQKKIDRLDVAKVDVEGFETRLLKGGLQSLKKLKPKILIELNPPALEKTGTSVDELLGLLKNLGYGFFLIERKKIVPMGALPDDPEYLINALCIPK